MEKGDEAFNKSLETHLQQAFGHCARIQRHRLKTLHEGLIEPRSTVISTIEFSHPLLSEIGPEDLARVKCVTNDASNVLWITGAGTLKARDPFRSIVFGLARAITLEQPSLKFAVLDLDVQGLESDLRASEINVELIVREMCQESHSDVEYLQHNGILYCSRFLPERHMNESFNKKQSAETTMTPLGRAGTCRLSLKEPGQLDTLHFMARETGPQELQAGFLEVQVKSVGLNAKVRRLNFECFSRLIDC